MKPIHIKRLRKLIAFLRKLPRKKFFFGTEFEKTTEQQCPTVACAIGWTPNVFPKLVGWSKIPDRGLFVYGNRKMSYSQIAEKLFGIPDLEAANLFYPHDQRNVDKRLPQCGYNATPKEVANMLEKYLQLQTAE